MALSDLKRCWLWQSDDSAFFIEDRTKIWMFVFKITGVNMHTTQALLTLLNNVQGLSFRLKSCSFRFFSFSLLLVKIIHFLMAWRRSHSQRRRFVEPAAGPFWEGWILYLFFCPRKIIIMKYYRLSHDVVTLGCKRDVLTVHC